MFFSECHIKIKAYEDISSSYAFKKNMKKLNLISFFHKLLSTIEGVLATNRLFSGIKKEWCIKIFILMHHSNWWRRQDSNLRPSGYEPDELPLLHSAIFVMQKYYIFLILPNVLAVILCCFVIY